MGFGKLIIFISFFEEEVAKPDKLLSSLTILNMLNEPRHYMYLSFLSFVLPFFTKLNTCMQAEKPKIHQIHSEVPSAIKSILSYYFKKRMLRQNSNY